MLVTYGVSAIVPLIDFILRFLISYLIKFEKCSTISEEETSLAKILWKIQFMTNAILPLVIAISLVNFFGAGGLIQTINGIYISNLILTPILLLFGNVFFYLRLWNIQKLKRFVNTGEGGPYTQAEAIKIYERFRFSMSYKYASAMKNLAMTLFYLPIYPIGSIYLLLLLLIQYWIEKVIYKVISSIS